MYWRNLKAASQGLIKRRHAFTVVKHATSVFTLGCYRGTFIKTASLKFLSSFILVAASHFSIGQIIVSLPLSKTNLE